MHHILYLLIFVKQFLSISTFAQSAEAVEYTDCTSAEG